MMHRRVLLLALALVPSLSPVTPSASASASASATATIGPAVTASATASNRSSSSSSWWSSSSSSLSRTTTTLSSVSSWSSALAFAHLCTAPPRPSPSPTRKSVADGMVRRGGCFDRESNGFDEDNGMFERLRRRRRLCSRRQGRRKSASSSPLFAFNDGGGGGGDSGGGGDRKKGVFSRPSAAIERGSGFFVPGLEGPRVRLVAGIALLSLTAVNHVFSSRGGGAGRDDAGSAFAEALAATYAILVLLQAAIEYAKESRGNAAGIEEIESMPSSSSSKVKLWEQVWSASVPPTEENMEWRGRVEWASQSYLALTPSAKYVHLIAPGGSVLYSLGEKRKEQQGAATGEMGGDGDDDESARIAGGAAALETLSKSAGGRVSLPSSHPAVTALAEPLGYGRCVVLQRVDVRGDEGQSSSSSLCWMISSDELLAGYTKQDLQWLGQLAKYIRP